MKDDFICWSHLNTLAYCWSQPSRALIAVCQPPHAAHDAEDIVIGGIHADLSGRGTLNSGVRENELKGGIVDTGKVAGAGRLVLLGAESKGVDVDTGVGVTGVALEGLDKVKVGALALRETILTVKLELGGNYGVLAPTMERKSGLREDKGTGVRDKRLGLGTGAAGSAASCPGVSTGRTSTSNTGGGVYAGTALGCLIVSPPSIACLKRHTAIDRTS